METHASIANGFIARQTFKRHREISSAVDCMFHKLEALMDSR